MSKPTPTQETYAILFAEDGETRPMITSLTTNGQELAAWDARARELGLNRSHFIRGCVGYFMRAPPAELCARAALEASQVEITMRRKVNGGKPTPVSKAQARKK